MRWGRRGLGQERVWGHVDQRRVNGLMRGQMPSHFTVLVLLDKLERVLSQHRITHEVGKERIRAGEGLGTCGPAAS